MATDWFDKTINKDENYAIGWSNKLVCLINSGFLTDAERIINLTVEMFPTNSYILNEKGRIYLEKGDYKKLIVRISGYEIYDWLNKILTSFISIDEKKNNKIYNIEYMFQEKINRAEFELI